VQGNGTSRREAKYLQKSSKLHEVTQLETGTNELERAPNKNCNWLAFPRVVRCLENFGSHGWS
jgi:hypothetical protein